MTRYEHTQIGYVTIAAVSVAAVVVAIIAISALPPDREILFGVFVVLVLTAFVFRKLTIKIENEMLRACFGSGLICKKVPLVEIVAVRLIRIRWWYGWGIHLVPTPYGWCWLYNISGWNAVAIKLRDGRRLALGTDDPDGLVTAIGAASGRMQVRATT